MRKIHHYIVSFDTSTGAWKWDTDLEADKFDDGTIFSYEDHEWSSAYLGDGEYDPDEENLINQLKHALGVMNLVNGVSNEEY
jgi:hypothetical protein